MKAAARVGLAAALALAGAAGPAGATATGWSMAGKANLRARLHDGNHAHTDRDFPAIGAGDTPGKGRQTPMTFVRYADFGAKGDGTTDDLEAIVRAHAFANAQGLPVRADDGATYYIGGQDRTVVVQTDTDLGTAAFVIDDTAVTNIKAPVFEVTSARAPVKIEGLTSLQRGQAKLDVPLPGRSVVIVTDSHTRRYIRRGLNQNSGSPQTDAFLVDGAGNVDTSTPVIWDFARVTDATAHPVDEVTLTLTGGRFTTRANRAPSTYAYHNRNIRIRRSNVVIDGLEHRLTGEGDHGAPYGGFLLVTDCAHVTVSNSVFSGHRTYQTRGSAGKPVSMGSYDLSLSRALNVSFVNCRQANDIHDRTRWGIMGSNFCKNLLYDGCSLSRFDAHQGVFNATIRNSTLGHGGITAIGAGLLRVEGTSIHSGSVVSLRGDYGSTWQGEIVIRDCRLVPPDRRRPPVLVNGVNDGAHDFGYACSMPERVTVEKLHVDDAEDPPPEYAGPAVFADFNPPCRDPAYVEKHPIARPREVVLANVTTASGLALRVGDNPRLFQDVVVRRRDDQ